MMLGFIGAYVLTVGIETAIAFLLLRNRFDPMLIARNSVLASTLTLPFVWFVFPVLGPGSWALLTALAEIFAFVVEAGVYRALFPGMNWVDALRTSFLCNAASFMAGLLLVF
jgi:hypothetical protein